MLNTIKNKFLLKKTILFHFISGLFPSFIKQGNCFYVIGTKQQKMLLFRITIP
jgi:hypothetical protein